MATIPVRTGNGDIVSNDQDAQSALVPILAECCGLTCQTITATGTATVVEEQYSGPGGYSYLATYWRSPEIAFIMANGAYFACSVSFFGGGYNVPYTTYSDVVASYSIITVEGEEYQGTEFFDGGIVNTDDPWEIRVSWCEDCTVLCEVDIAGALFAKAQIVNACGLLGDEECSLVTACRSETTLGNTMVTGSDITVSATDIGGGIIEVTITDDNATGLIADAAAALAGSTTGAVFGCGSSCILGGFTALVYADVIEDPGLGPPNLYALPIPDTYTGFNPAGVAGTEAIFEVGGVFFPDCPDMQVAIANALTFWQDWITTYGDGVPVTVQNLTTDAVECTDLFIGLATVTDLTPAAAGFIIPQAGGYNPDPEFSNIESFAQTCGSLTPGGTVIELSLVGEG